MVAGSSTNFAYQGMIGVGWNIDPQFRLNLEGRYYGTTSPTVNNPFAGGVTFNNNISLIARPVPDSQVAVHSGPGRASTASACTTGCASTRGPLRMSAACTRWDKSVACSDRRVRLAGSCHDEVGHVSPETKANRPSDPIRR